MAGSTSIADCRASSLISTDQCKHGGWRHLVDRNGTPFKNQGDCVSYVATGGRNLADGPSPASSPTIGRSPAAGSSTGSSSAASTKARTGGRSRRRARHALHRRSGGHARLSERGHKSVRRLRR
jgi:hypothetical protein